MCTNPKMDVAQPDFSGLTWAIYFLTQRYEYYGERVEYDRHVPGLGEIVLTSLVLICFAQIYIFLLY